MYKNKTKFYVLIIIIVLTSLNSCMVKTDEVVIYVKGSVSMSHVFKEIAESYTKSKNEEQTNLPEVIYGIIPGEKDTITIPSFDRSKIRFIFIEGGSARGIGSLVDGNKNNELILSARKIEPAEIKKIENINRTYIGNIIYMFKYSEDKIIPVTNVKNPRDSILKKEITSILKGGISDIKTWSAMYPPMNDSRFVSDEGLKIDTSIQIALRERGSSVNYKLRTKLTGGVITENILEISSDKHILEYVSKIYNSLSFVSTVYKPLFPQMGVKELEVREAVSNNAGITVSSKPLEESLIERDCYIIFMKNQKGSQAIENLEVAIDDILLDFINYANSSRINDSDTLKGKDIGKKYYSFD